MRGGGICAKRPCSLCAQIRSSCLLVCLVGCLVAEVIDFYHEDMEGSHMRWFSGTLKSGFWRVSKSYPSLIALATGIWHKRGPLFDHFWSDFFLNFWNRSAKMGLLPVKPDLQRIGDAMWRAKMFRDHGNWRRFLKNTCFTLIFLLNWCCCSKLRRFSDQTKIVWSTWIENHGLIELNWIILPMLRALPRTVCLVLTPR